MAIKNIDVLTNLSKDKLKQYIFYLTQKYYMSYKERDFKAYNLALEQLFFIVEEYDDKYTNLQGFICYSLYLNANVELMKKDDQLTFKLDPVFKMDLLENDVEDLPFDIKNIFNKQRIRGRYNAKRTCEHVE